MIQYIHVQEDSSVCYRGAALQTLILPPPAPAQRNNRKNSHLGLLKFHFNRGHIIWEATTPEKTQHYH